MKIQNIAKKNLSYLGRKCQVTEVFYSKNKEEKHLFIRNFADGETDYKLIEGFAGRYEKNIPFKEFSKEEAKLAYDSFVAGVK